MRVLLGWCLRRDRRTLLWLALVLMVFEVLLAWIANVMEVSGSYQVLASAAPPFIRRALGFDITVLLSFTGALCVGYLHPVALAVISAGIMMVARGPVAEIDARTCELLVARPVARSAPVWASLMELTMVAVLFASAMLAGTTVGALLVGRYADVAMERFFIIALNCALLMLALGALFALIAALSSRVQAYTHAAVTLALASYVIDWLARLWRPIAPLRKLALFSYYDPVATLLKTNSATDLLVLAGVAVCASAAALLIYQHRDL